MRSLPLRSEPSTTVVPRTTRARTLRQKNSTRFSQSFAHATTPWRGRQLPPSRGSTRLDELVLSRSISGTPSSADHTGPCSGFSMSSSSARLALRAMTRVGCTTVVERGQTSSAWARRPARPRSKGPSARPRHVSRLVPYSAAILAGAAHFEPIKRGTTAGRHRCCLGRKLRRRGELAPRSPAQWRPDPPGPSPASGPGGVSDPARAFLSLPLAQPLRRAGYSSNSDRSMASAMAR